MRPAAEGEDLIASEVFASITTNSRRLLLSWTGPEAAAAFGTAEAESVRVRIVRVIRDYGMADRRETPQFSPPIGR